MSQKKNEIMRKLILLQTKMYLALQEEADCKTSKA